MKTVRQLTVNFSYSLYQGVRISEGGGGVSSDLVPATVLANEITCSSV